MRDAARLAGFLLLFAALAPAQGVRVYTIDTVAGGAVYDNLPATGTPLNAPQGLLLDRGGALWIADAGNQVIRRVDLTTGAMRVMAGGGAVLEDSVPVEIGRASCRERV